MAPMAKRYSHAVFVVDHSHQPGLPFPGAASTFSISPAETGPASATTPSTRSRKPGWSARSLAALDQGPSRNFACRQRSRGWISMGTRDATWAQVSSRRPIPGPARPGGGRQEVDGIVTEPREQRQIVRPGHHVHGIDLQQPDPIDGPTQMAAVVGRRLERQRGRQSLCRDGRAAGLGSGQLRHHSTTCCQATPTGRWAVRVPRTGQCKIWVQPAR